jgi:hypothetical protein
MYQLIELDPAIASHIEAFLPHRAEAAITENRLNFCKAVLIKKRITELRIKLDKFSNSRSPRVAMITVTTLTDLFRRAVLHQMPFDILGFLFRKDLTLFGSQLMRVRAVWAECCNESLRNDKL